ncbi:MAG: helix-turn-helix transcriptional regulator [Acidimicrobiales bacterium]|nr:helix-turn-helix transcriptional regulator [Acidimicrobiales bacterium]
MHLVPSERAHRRIIDGERACVAIAALQDQPSIHQWSSRFSMLADPTRLKVLLCIKAAGPISVSDLAVAADLNDDTASQALRHLRAGQAVCTEREGRIVRYRVADPVIEGLLERVTGASQTR